jgi:SsrA-binding protein
MAKKTDDEGKKTIAKNRKAFHDFFIVEQVEAGLVLTGSEVKSLRDGKAVLDDAFARVKDGEAQLIGLSIPQYANAGYATHEPDRVRRLLLHRREIAKIVEKTQVERLTIVPLELYWKRGFAKVLLGIAKGKKLHDKRQVLREKEDKRAIQRAYRGRE